MEVLNFNFMIKNLLSLYYYQYPKALASLLRSSHYKASSYLKEIHRTKDFTAPLEKPVPKTKKSLSLIWVLSMGMLAQIAVGILFIVLGIDHHVPGGIFFGIAIILLYPIVWAYVPLIALLMKDWYKMGQSLDEKPSS